MIITVIVATVVIIAILVVLQFLISNETENFDIMNDMQTFVINLKNRPDRKMRMLNELNKNNISGIFIEAVDGRTLDGNNINKIYKKIDSYRSLRAGEIGCYLSHINCWDLILESKKPYGLILEDDVVFSENFSNNMKELFYNIKNKEWDIIALGRRCDKKLFTEDCTSGEIIHGNIFYPNFIGYATYAYIIKADTIRKLLKNTFPISKPIDVVLIDEQQKKNIKIISFINNLVSVYNLSDSDTTRIK